ncbi:hypothetical protein M8J77_020089 [Diaphorina citri]|nr:hypothetical protein M8J77_020089 [Diaphorina citri]
MNSNRGFKSLGWSAFTILVAAFTLLPTGQSQPSPPAVNCDYIDAEVNSYQPVVDRIIAAVSQGGHFQAHTYSTLANFVDKFGPRMTGSEALENSIDFMVKESKDFGLEVWTENVTAPKWERKFEKVTLVKPWKGDIPVSTLGSSMGTPQGGITAEVVVFKSFAELIDKSNLVAGKIVVFNQDFVSYGETVKYRSKGASVASKYGAVATLIRSVTPYSLATPHTGHQSYDAGVKPIPTACIAPEYAEMLYRMYRRGDGPVVVSINIDARNVGTTNTRNTIVQIRGRECPDKVVITSGHLDSWDVGQGAMDDGGGAFISWNSLVLLQSLQLKPRRTIRGILWTAEEQGYVGAIAYVKKHQEELKNITVAMESDDGTFTPFGLSLKGSPEAACILNKVLRLFKPINATRLVQSKYPVGSDIELFQEKNIPGVALLNDNAKYFWYHHSRADTMSVLDSDTLDLCTALWGGVAYILADLSVELPRT